MQDPKHKRDISGDVTLPSDGMFPLTRWSLIHRLRDPVKDEKQERDVKNEICRCYWSPLQKLGMNLGLSPQDAEDATQTFFIKLLQGFFWDRVEESRGRLRAFLCAAYKRHLVDDYRRKMAQKRGGDWQQTDYELLEYEPLLLEKTHPDVHLSFERDWARSLVQQATEQLRSFYEARGKTSLFLALEPMLGLEATERDGMPSNDLLEKTTGLTGSSLRMALMRLRERFRQELLIIVSGTLSDASPEDALDELREVVSILQAGHEK